MKIDLSGHKHIGSCRKGNKIAAISLTFTHIVNGEAEKGEAARGWFICKMCSSIKTKGMKTWITKVFLECVHN